MCFALSSEGMWLMFRSNFNLFPIFLCSPYPSSVSYFLHSLSICIKINIKRKRIKFYSSIAWLSSWLSCKKITEKWRFVYLHSCFRKSRLECWSQAPLSWKNVHPINTESKLLRGLNGCCQFLTTLTSFKRRALYIKI